MITILKYNKIHIKEKKNSYYSCTLRYIIHQVIKIYTKDDHTKTEQFYDKNNENCATFAILQGY
jgi:hypothetical protein